MGTDRRTHGWGDTKKRLTIIWERAPAEERQLLIFIAEKQLHSRNMRKVLEHLAQSKHIINYN